MQWYRLRESIDQKQPGSHITVASFNYGNLRIGENRDAFPWRGSLYSNGWSKSSILPDLIFNEETFWKDFFLPEFLGSDAVCLSEEFHSKLVTTCQLQNHWSYRIKGFLNGAQKKYHLIRFIDHEKIDIINWQKSTFYEKDN